MKNKIVSISIIAVTIILAGVAIFTALRLYQLRQEPVAPTAPESEPEAFHPTNPKQVVWHCGSITQGDIDNMPGRCEDERTCAIGTTGSTNIFDIIINATDETPQQPGENPSNYDQCIANTLNQPVNNYKTTFEIKAERASEPITITYVKNSNWCPEPCGNTTGICVDNIIRETGQATLNSENNYRIVFDIERTSDNNQACGSFQTDLWLTEISNCTTGFNPPPENDWGTLTWGLFYTGQECPVLTPTPTPTPSPSPTPTPGTKDNICEPLNFTLVSPTPSPTTTASPTPTPKTTATPTPLAYCNNTCSTNSNCESGLICSSGSCRNPSCINETDCNCSTTSPTPTVTATPKPATQTTPAPTQEPSLPDAGISSPTIVGISAGVILLLLSIVLAI